jgi:hypothetical protein
LNLWYLDDGTIAGDPRTVLQDFQLVIQEAAKIGLEVNPSKCEIITLTEDPLSSLTIHGMFNDLAPGIKLLEKTEARLLGTALFPEGIDSVLENKMEHLKRLVERLSVIDSHDALFLLKHCLALPKLLYTLRTAPCFYSNILPLYDNILKEGIELITNTSLNNSNWCQAVLPVNFGGLGIRRASELALPAFLSSIHSVSESINVILPDYCCHDTAKCEALTLFSEFGEVPNNPKVQKSWDSVISAQRKDQLLSLTADPKQKARILAASSPSAGAWLNAVPISSLGLKLDNCQLRIAIALRLGAPICHPHKCHGCGGQVDASGSHGLSCRKSAGRHSRHSHVNDLIKRALISARIPSVLEPSGIFRSDGKRPDGMSLMPWKQGRSLLWDFTCPDTLALSHLSSTSISAGAAALKAERAKELKYNELSSTFIFQPIAVETLGSWSTSGLRFIKGLGEKVSVQTGEKKATSYLLQSISIAIQRGNAVSIMATVPPSRNLDELFYI